MHMHGGQGRVQGERTANPVLTLYGNFRISKQLMEGGVMVRFFCEDEDEGQ